MFENLFQGQPWMNPDTGQSVATPGYLGGLLGGGGGMGGLLGSPLLQLGLGILAANRPGASFGQAVGQGGLLGMQNLQQARQAAGIGELRKVQLAKAQREMEQEDAWRKAIGSMVGGGAGVTPIPNAPVPSSPGLQYADASGATPAAAPSNPMLAGIPPALYPVLSDPQRGPALLGQFALKDANRAQWVSEDRNGVPGQVNRTTGEWKPLDPSLTKVSVGVTMPPEQDAESKKVGAFYGDAYTGLQNATLTNPGKRARLQRLDTLLDNVDTGTGAETTLAIKKAAKGAGFDLDALGVKDNVGSAEAGRALANEMALELRNPQGGAGMPGALSDSDRAFLQSMSPGLSTTPQGRKLILQSRLKLMDREDQVAKMARDYRKAHGHIDEGFFNDLAAFSEKSPIFSQEDMAKIQTAPAPAAPAASAPAANPYASMSDEQVLQRLREQGFLK